MDGQSCILPRRGQESDEKTRAFLGWVSQDTICIERARNREALLKASPTSGPRVSQTRREPLGWEQALLARPLTTRSPIGNPLIP
ncbi:hypothetical protein LIER_44147 [Lithospermum erythrorhizon]|uniref:Uncharacterized protein n=1 Tax=Lithospermum erythrorhizon TaxID=34254 RepID=A0AAV3QLU9_LITER